MSQPWTREVDRYCHQYLQLEAKLDIPRREILRLPEVQDAIFAKIFADGAIRYEPPVRFKFKTLKDLVSHIEESIDDWDRHEVSGDILDAMGVLLSTPLPPEILSSQKKFYVTYHVSGMPPDHSSSSSSGRKTGSESSNWKDDRYITLLENRSLIAGSGTTGLRTWEAGLHLGQFLCQSPEIIRGKEILELGAGTGYLSVLCARHLGAARVIASDGSDDVINNLPENLFLNDLQDSRHQVIPMDVKWGHALVGTEETDWNGGRPVDVVLGADVTYDDRVVPALVATLGELFVLYPDVNVYISAAERNEKTFHVFLDSCREQGLMVDILDFPVPPPEEQTGPFYSVDVAMSICRVSR
ncbi:putative methyltransferase [Geosmithia morbida]|uniref:Methyltransferase n=1 Tax=Geosmithia morbida TaxID=1094350 RepID=A0A9P4YPA5_9HYPO|nr:putative methyltransferase [Geosmithia morbida]KAF4120072.1 putative methyltransferase [Geosmithia morbida]